MFAGRNSRRWASAVSTAQPRYAVLLDAVLEYVDAANRETFIVIQIEHASALDHVDEIAKVPGVDVLMLGPADFSVLSGIPGQFDHNLVRERQAEDRGGRAQRRHSLGPAPARSLQHIQEALELGARFICHGADILMVKRGLEQIRRGSARRLGSRSTALQKAE